MGSRIESLPTLASFRINRDLAYITEDSYLLPITTRRRRSINSRSSSHWDIELATRTDDGFALLARETSPRANGQYRIFFTNQDGETISRSQWITRDELTNTLFYDQNMITDDDNNGIVDGSEQSAYQIYSNGEGITITDRRGRTFNDGSNRHWDVTAAGEINNGFAVLRAGKSNRRSGQYRLWFTTTEGRIQSGTSWESGDFYQQQGYETVFNVDLNNDGQIRDPSEPALENDGEASILITGNTEQEGTLSILLNADDPDGNGNLGLQLANWEYSNDNGLSWTSLGFSETLTVTPEIADSLVRAKLNYIDGEGFDEIIISESVNIPALPPETNDDFGNTPTTSGFLSIDGTTTGILETDGDRDWFQVNLTIGSIYNFAVTGESLSDPYLRLYNNDGALIRENDDHNGTLDSAINDFEATSTGQYYLGVGAYSDIGRGSYQVSARKEERVVINDGFAAIQIIENTEQDSLSVQLEADDPDGNGDLESQSPLWENSTDNGQSWSSLGSSATLTVTPEIAESLVRVRLTYIDGEGFDETIISDSVSIPALPPETNDDFDDTASTDGFLNIGSTTTGNLEVEGDRDWFKVDLTIGGIYNFAVTGESLGDPYLRLYNNSGLQIDYNDDAYNGTYNSAINSFEATSTGQYFLGVGAYNDAGTGSYLISASESEVNPPGYSPQDGYGQINIQRAFEQHLDITLDPVVDLGGNLWSLDNIYAPEVWTSSGDFSGATGSGSVVAVVDTGVDLDHREFSGRIVQGYDFVSNDSFADDGNGHGTHVAGTIAGANDGFGVTGVAYNAQIMPIRVLDNNGSGYTSDVIEGIRYAADNGANVINLSLGGGGHSQAMDDAIAYATSLGSVVVMAAGNSGGSSPDYPAAHAINYGLAVGAVDQSGNMANFSNLAGDVVLDYVTAPGVNIYSSTPGNNYDSFNGTSMATPHVAGAAALLLGHDPNLSAATVEDLLTGTASNNDTSTSSTSQDPLTSSDFDALTNYSRYMTSDTVGSFSSDDLTGTWIGRLSSDSQSTSSWGYEQAMNSYNLDWDQLTNNLVAFELNSTIESHSLVSELLNSNQFDYFEADKVWSIA